MKGIKNVLKVTLLAGLLGGVLLSCEEEFNTIGTSVINEAGFNVEKAYFNAYVTNRKLKATQTNNLPLYQLGRYTDPIYGETNAVYITQVSLAGGNPTFGAYSQEVENNADTDGNDATIEENETVTKVYLNIPFFTANDNDTDNDGVDDEFDVDPKDPASDSDGDGVSDANETNIGTDPLNPDTDGDGINDGNDDDTVQNAYPKTFTIDSIYGNIEADFNLKVEQFTYYLRDLDPNSGFQENQAYYSNQDFSSFTGDLLFDGPIEISNEEILIFEEDDSSTDEDESLTVKERIAPGIRAELNAQFFQDNVLNKEGSTELISNTNFKEFLRGLYISTHSFSEDIYMLLDIAMANITIEYEYDAIEGDEQTKKNGTYALALNSTVNQTVNTFSTSNTVDVTGDSRIYLKGGAGNYAEIKLFDADDNTTTALDNFKANNWLINEASLSFYVDREALNAANVSEEPLHLFLYDVDNDAVIADYSLDLAQQLDPEDPFPIYGGKLEVDSNGKGIKYTFNITEHIFQILRNDEDNVRLGLSVSSNLIAANTDNGVLEDDSEVKIPVASTINPLGTVLIGNNVSQELEAKKLQLEITYTEINQ
jgi:hypothetical protein